MALRLLPLRLLLVAVFLLTGGEGLRAQWPPAPEADFPQIDMGPLLAEKVSAGVNGGITYPDASATGDGGWLAAWGEQGRQGAPWRVVARLLPPELRGPVNGQGKEESGFASEATAIPLSSDYPSFLTISGTGGAWLTWMDAGQLRARWFDQAARGPVGGTLTLRMEKDQTLYGLSGGAGDGQRACLVWRGHGDGGDFRAGAVLENTPGGPVVSARFALPQRYTGTVPPVAAAGHCLFSVPAILPDAGAGGVIVGTVGGSHPPPQELLVVDAAGKVSAPHPLDLPGGAAWTGAIPTENGFLGLWQVDYTPRHQVL